MVFVCLFSDDIFHVNKQIRTGAKIASVIGEQGIVICSFEYL